MDVQTQVFLTLALVVGEWSASHPGSFIPLGGPWSRSRVSNLARKRLINVDPGNDCISERTEGGGREVIRMLDEERGNCFFGNVSFFVRRFNTEIILVL
jgi:hypothetical protein